MIAKARKPDRVLSDTFSEPAPRKRRMYHTFAPEGQTQFLCGQHVEKRASAARFVEFRLAAFRPVRGLQQDRRLALSKPVIASPALRAIEIRSVTRRARSASTWSTSSSGIFTGAFRPRAKSFFLTAVSSASRSAET